MAPGRAPRSLARRAAAGSAIHILGLRAFFVEEPAGVNDSVAKAGLPGRPGCLPLDGTSAPKRGGERRQSASPWSIRVGGNLVGRRSACENAQKVGHLPEALRGQIMKRGPLAAMS